MTRWQRWTCWQRWTRCKSLGTRSRQVDLYFFPGLNFLGLTNNLPYSSSKPNIVQDIGGWRVSPTGKSFRVVRRPTRLVLPSENGAASWWPGLRIACNLINLWKAKEHIIWFEKKNREKKGRARWLAETCPPGQPLDGTKSEQFCKIVKFRIKVFLLFSPYCS